MPCLGKGVALGHQTGSSPYVDVVAARLSGAFTSKTLKLHVAHVVLLPPPLFLGSFHKLESLTLLAANLNMVL